MTCTYIVQEHTHIHSIEYSNLLHSCRLCEFIFVAQNIYLLCSACLVLFESVFLHFIFIKSVLCFFSIYCRSRNGWISKILR